MSFLHPEGEYAVCTVPGTPLNIYYWLSLFHEIDFQVNEGFRRIPHGGIEIGGLLFGRVKENSMHVEAFRAIDCEHSRGPSFVLSDRDVNLLREQIAGAPSDPELKDLEVLGWFVAHTRSQLELNETEAALFDDLFPTGKLMLLIKPERFQPTRFLFLVRAAEGKLTGGAPENAVILPLPARPQRAQEGAIPSLAAPASKPSAGPVAPDDAQKTAPIAEERTERPLAEPAPPAPVVPPPPDLPSVEEIRRRRSEIIAKPEPLETPVAPQQITQPTKPRGRRSNAQLAIVLFVAAALGCAVGYVIYLQLPPALIPLEIPKHAPVLTVSWPPDQTRDAVYAALRVDDGDPIPLSPQQKQQGQATVRSETGNVKVELIAQHWMRDSRGIVRYVEPLPASSAASPAATPPQ